MRRQFATFFLSLCWVHALFAGYSLELNSSLDYFRGMPEGSWNGNNGLLIGGNAAIPLSECTQFQLGGSYATYNWDGRGNVVFANPKVVQQIGFLTAGVSTVRCDWSVGIAYDRMFATRFGIYSLSPSIDQFRFQFGYTRCQDEVGVWGTVGISTSHKQALGIPTAFRAIGQMNLFWRHQFENCAHTNLWVGIPYQDSLMFSHERAGNAILGFSFRTPLCGCLFLDGNSSYMCPRKSSGVVQSRNYGFNMCLGVTWCFDCGCECYETPYMSIANHSNFFVDTNVNQ